MMAFRVTIPMKVPRSSTTGTKFWSTAVVSRSSTGVVTDTAWLSFRRWISMMPWLSASFISIR